MGVLRKNMDQLDQGTEHENKTIQLYININNTKLLLLLLLTYFTYYLYLLLIYTKHTDPFTDPLLIQLIHFTENHLKNHLHLC